MIQILECTDLQSEHVAFIHALWNNEYPESLRHTSLSETMSYLDGLEKPHHWFATDNNLFIGWLTVFGRDDADWFAMILDSSYQKQGIGRRLLKIAKGHKSLLNGWVIDHNSTLKANGETYFSPLDFYTKNGFVTTNKRLELPNLSAINICWDSKIELPTA